PTRLVAEAIGDKEAERAAVVFYGLPLFVVSSLIGAIWSVVARHRELLAVAPSEEPFQRRRDEPVERVPEQAAGGAAGEVGGRPVEAGPKRTVDRGAVPAHRLHVGRGHEREHELLAARVQLARRAVQPREREALDGPVEPAARERRLRRARIGEP